MFMFRLASLKGDTKAVSGELYERLRRFGQSGDEVQINPNFKVAALIQLAEAALRAGVAADARQWLDRASKVLDRTRASTSSALGRALVVSLNGVAMMQSGDPAAALAVLRQGQSDIAKVLGAKHPQSLLLSLNEALALEQLRRNADAMLLVEAVEPGLRTSLGSDAPTYRRVLALRDRLQVDSGADGADARVQLAATRAEFFN